MSINVTVTGNPVSIRRGKMVTIDSYGKNEFEKRRIMRLEQVRQQSKDIAEDVRNKVRKEKRKQMKHIEEEGKEKLRNWQNRKLLELQTQYKTALHEIGVGHKEAQNVAEEQEILEEQKEHNQQVSVQHGYEAATKLQAQKNEERLKKSIPVQRKKIVRDIENTRATLVSNIQKTSKNKSANRNISVPKSNSTCASESESKTSVENNILDIPHLSTGFCDCSEDSEPPKSPLKSNKNNEQASINSEFQLDERPVSTQVSEVHIGKAPFNIQQRICLSSPIDTRISDRIRQRNVLTTQPDYCDTAGYQSSFNDHSRTGTERNQYQPVKDLGSRLSHLHNGQQCMCERTIDTEKPVCSVCKHYVFVKDKENIPHTEFLNSCHCCCTSVPIDRSINERQKRDQAINTSEQNVDLQAPQIPTKPPVRLKQTVKSSSVTSRERNKVHYYDHSNRFSAEKEVPSNSFVERMTADSLEVNPNEVSEAEFYRKMTRRDKEVQARGKKAFEQQKIQKDYEEIMKKMPLLQKKERTAKIRMDKPEYHMNDERLKELERKRQNDMDNAFNKGFANLKPVVVTLPKRQQPQVTKINTHRLESSDSEMIIAQWDVDVTEPKIFTAQEVQDIVKAFIDQNPSERRMKLKELLQTLKLQKEQLIQEIKSLPRDESINELINDLNSVDNILDQEIKRKEKKKPERKRLRVENDNEVSIDSSSSSHSSNSSSEVKRHQKSVRRRTVSHSSKVSRSPRKKAKPKSCKEVIIMQNTSTQTTPKVVSWSEDNSDNIEKRPESNIDKNVLNEICPKAHIPCTCKSTGNATSEELCQIFIRLDDKESLQVVTKPKSRDNLHPESESKELHSVGIGTNQDLSTKDSDPFVTPSNERIQKMLNTHKKEIRQRKDITQKTAIKTKHAGLSERDKKKRTSWGEQLSKNSISTTSTSYMSPPDLQKPHLVFGNLLSPTGKKFKSKKTENTSMARTIDENQNIAAYINKLLGMSRASADNLNSSSTSSVTTPSQSIIEMESNIPNARLLKLIKFINLNIDGQLSYSPDVSNIHFNTSASEVSLKTEEKHFENQEQTPIEDLGKSEEMLLEQYTNITKSCSKRIASLTEMIKKIREEKIQILQTSVSGSSSSKQSSSSDFDEEEMFKQLIHIDLNLAEKLKSMTDAGSKKKRAVLVTPTKDSYANAEPTDLNNKEFLARLEGLKQREPSRVSPETMSSNTDGLKETVFVPFLSDIPKLPKFEPQPFDGTQNKNNHRHPPTSKGLTVAKKYNENILLVPHELSTIVEADSQLSARITTSPTSKTSLSSFKDVEVIVIPNVTESCEEVKKRSDQSKSKSLSKSKSSLSKSKSSPITEVNDNVKVGLLSKSESSSPTSAKQDSDKNQKQASNSSNDLEAIEEMLKSIGMEWAIPTIHKTKEALALASSSSSSESSVKHFGNESSSGDISLKGFLQKQFMGKISSSNLISDVSLLSDLSDLSVIQFGQLSVEKARPRTSTPVTHSKSTSKSKDSSKQLVYSEESDISSVVKESEVQTSK